jgi:hypothetical protein
VGARCSKWRPPPWLSINSIPCRLQLQPPDREPAASGSKAELFTSYGYAGKNHGLPAAHDRPSGMLQPHAGPFKKRKTAGFPEASRRLDEPIAPELHDL